MRNLRHRSIVVNMQKMKKTTGRLTAAARRAQLIEVGREVFAERGYGATSVEEIAARAKVSKPILYSHFGGKEGLFAVVVDREVEYILSRIAEAVSTGPPRARLERAALAYLTYVEERPLGFAVLQRDAPYLLVKLREVLPEMCASFPEDLKIFFERRIFFYQHNH